MPDFPNKPFSSFPHDPTIPLHPFAPHILQSELDHLHSRLNNAGEIRITFENSFSDRDLGIKKGWMDEALEYWREGFNWSAFSILL